MKKVDIIFDTPLNAIIGPVQTVKRILCNKDFFATNGYEIDAFTRDNLSENTILKVKNNKSSLVVKLKVYAKKIAQKSFLYSVFRVYICILGSKRLIKFYNSQHRRPSIVVFHAIFDCYQYMRINGNNGVKTCLFTHSDGLMYKQLLDNFPKLKGTFIEKKLMDIANYVMDRLTMNPCIARIEEVNHLKLFPQIMGKTCLVINAIDDLSEEQNKVVCETRNYFKSPKYRLICVGGISGRKGQRTIIEALHKLTVEKLSDIHVSIIGDGPSKVVLEELIQKYGLLDHVSFEGAIVNTEIYKYLARANIFILMSENEGLPIALLEALRSGLALIGTNVSGIPELIKEDINGKLLNPNVDELVCLLNEMNNYDWIEMGKQSRNLFEDYYTFARMRDDYLKMLNKVIDDN